MYTLEPYCVYFLNKEVKADHQCEWGLQRAVQKILGHTMLLYWSWPLEGRRGQIINGRFKPTLWENWCWDRGATMLPCHSLSCRMLKL